jgi:hypothetical protein
MAITFWARGDSSSANNAEINAQPEAQVPTTELTFEASDADGDTLLEFNDGGSDPDTVLIIDGVERTFTLEFSGTVPTTQKYANIGGVDLRGADVVVITDDLTGQRYFLLTDPDLNTQVIMAAFPNGATSIDNINTTDPVEICFVRGTEVDTPDGPRKIEDLKVGDLVLTDQGPMPIRWIGSNRWRFSDLMLQPKIWPVRISAGAFGDGLPSQPLTLSPDHRVVIEGADVDLAVGAPRALCAVKFLAIRDGIQRVLPDEGVEYFHLLLDSHRLVKTYGLDSESLSRGPRAVQALGPVITKDLHARGLLDTKVKNLDRAPLPVMRRFEALALT